MRSATDLINNPGKSRQPTTSQSLTEEQVDAVVYFYARLDMTDPTQFKTMFPDKKTEKLSKQEYAPHIISLSKKQIDGAFDQLHKLRQSGNPDYKWLNIDQVIGLCSDQAPAGIYKMFPPALPEPEETKHKRKDLGRRTLDSILSTLK